MMDKEEVHGIIERFRQALTKQGVTPSQIVLFGSFAKGTSREASDIDLVVVSPDFEGKAHWEWIDLMVEALLEVWEPIESIAMTPEEWEKGDSMIAMFAREGEVAYSA